MEKKTGVINADLISNNKLGGGGGGREKRGMREGEKVEKIEAMTRFRDFNVLTGSQTQFWEFNVLTTAQFQLSRILTS